ncbi:MAG: AAA family ATPase [Candidatus Omnitrophica bacterium]|nr:AAA family ATPase [Candidatus Omnitrophota bacterium]
MAVPKFVKYLRYNWGWLLLVSLLTSIVLMVIVFTVFGAQSFMSMEGFSRRALLANMLMYIVIFLPVGIIQAFISTFIYFYFMMGGGMSRLLGSSDAEQAKTEVFLKDVIGLESAKLEALEIVQFIKDGNKIKAIGGTMIKGVLMIGPPGCGKTHLAKAMANECGLPFLSAVGSEFVGMFVGLGASRMKSLFKKARTTAAIEGGCLIFIDEIDAFAGPRQQDAGFGGGVSHNATINQFLTELDGLRKRENNIVVIAATNVAPEKLDDAIMRSGRFDRKIFIEKPTAKEREKLLSYYLSKISHDPAIDIALVADKAQWFSPADIANLVRESSILAMRNQRASATQEDVLSALKVIMGHLEKTGQEKILYSRTPVKWDEVIGMADAKTEAWELVKILKDRSLLKAIGGKIVKGLVLFGPPGCGKTYLVKAIATEAGFPLIAVSGAETIGMYVGSGSNKIASVFKEARQLAKAEGGCILFFDEIDTFATPRYHAEDLGSSRSHNATVNQFLTEIDGLKQEENNIVVIGATNVAEGTLDSAIIRAGRLERKIYVDLPNVEDREALFKFYLGKVASEPDVDPMVLARTTIAFSPSDIDNMVREAGLIAMRNNRASINKKDLSEAYDRITMGSVTNVKYNKQSLHDTAVHEAGHAIITYLVHPSNEVIKATIRPRKNALGYIYARPLEELKASSPHKEELISMIKVSLAGYAAEKTILGTTSAGVGGGPGSDFFRAMQLARLMVYSLGMGTSGLLGDFESLKSQAGFSVSEKTKETLDNDVQKILQDGLNDINGLLQTHKELLAFFSDELLKKGDLEYDEIQQIFDKFGLKPGVRATV